jgi:hypothetical protein
MTEEPTTMTTDDYQFDNLPPEVASLLATMFDEEEWIGDRLKAAEILLSFEGPEIVRDSARAFLRDRVLTSDAGTTLRNKAAEILQRTSVKKVSPGSTHGEPFEGMAERMEEARKRSLAGVKPERRMTGDDPVARANRRVALWEAGLWPAGIDDTLTDRLRRAGGRIV